MLDVERQKRYHDILSIRKHGYTLEEIAKRYDLSTERVRQILKTEENKQKDKEAYGELCNLTTRTRNALLRAGVKGKQDLILKLENGVLVRNIGEKSIKEIELFIQKNINGKEYKEVEIFPNFFVVHRVLKY